MSITPVPPSTMLQTALVGGAQTRIVTTLIGPEPRTSPAPVIVTESSVVELSTLARELSAAFDRSRELQVGETTLQNGAETTAQSLIGSDVTNEPEFPQTIANGVDALTADERAEVNRTVQRAIADAALQQALQKQVSSATAIPQADDNRMAIRREEPTAIPVSVTAPAIAAVGTPGVSVATTTAAAVPTDAGNIDSSIALNNLQTTLLTGASATAIATNPHIAAALVAYHATDRYSRNWIPTEHKEPEVDVIAPILVIQAVQAIQGRQP